MAQEVEKVNGISFSSIEKINGKTDANIENFNSFEFSAPSFGPPSVDAISEDTESTGASTQTHSHTTGSGVGRGMIVAVSQTDTGGGGAPAVPSGVTYGGVAMAQETTNYLYADQVRVTVFTLVNPASGANNVVASFSATTGAASSIKVITFAGLKQTDMFAASAGAQWGFPDGVESVSYERDDMVVGTFGIDFLHIAGSPSSISAGAGTLIGSNLSGFNGRYISCTNTTVTFAWSWSGASNAVQQISRTISDVYS